VGSDAEHDAGGDQPVEAVSFAGLADLDEDLRTMSQSHAEVERWRRLSTRGRGNERPPAHEGSEAGRLTAPIVDPSDLDAERHAATTAPGTVAAALAPTAAADDGAELPSAPPDAIGRPAPRADAAETAKLPSIPPEAAAEIVKATRKSFPPPKDTPSAPPGSRVVLSSSPPAMLRPSSKPPPRVPRPTPRPREEDEAVDVHGWRPSEPDAVAPAPSPGLPAIPPPAPTEPEPTRTPAFHPGAPSRSPAPVPEPARMPLDEPIALTPGLVLMGSIVVVALVALAAWWVLR
jgi:hypothetical protein